MAEIVKTIDSTYIHYVVSEIGRKFIHKVDMSLIPVCNILGVNIAAIDINWLLDFTDKHIKELSGDYMCVSNVYRAEYPLVASPQGS